MDLVWRFAFSAIMAACVWLVHRRIGAYPPPLPRSPVPAREVAGALLLWGVAVLVPLLRMFWFSPWLEAAVPGRALRELVQAPLLSVPYVALPLLIVLGRDRWSARDLGLTGPVRSAGAAVFAVLFGLATGLSAYATNQAVIGIQPLSVGVSLLLLYNNDFLEEFLHRGVILSKLERSVGQGRAVWLGGVLFGLTHLVFDIRQLWATGPAFVGFAFLLQTMAGWLLGIVYVKTRSLWPGVAAHYLGNWLPGVLAGLLG